MIIVGSKQNVDDFKKFGLKYFIDAGMDYEKVLEDAEIFVGEDANPDKELAEQNANARRNHFGKPNKLVFPEMDFYRNFMGDRGVAASLMVAPHEVGHYIQNKYFPIGHPKWKEIEEELNLKIEYNTFYDSYQNKWNNGALEFAANLFACAIKLESDICYFDKNKELTFEIDPHFWRKWFFALWGQKYHSKTIEIQIDNKDYYINGVKNTFNVSPTIFNGRTMLELRDLLINVLGVKNEDIHWNGEQKKITFYM